MGSAAGALKAAATRVGLSADDYAQHLAAGLKYCYRCGAWHPRADFARDLSRSDGLVPACRESVNRNSRTRYKPRQRQTGRRFVAAREGDALQARRRVNYLVELGELPPPGAIACTDCGHLGDGPRHEYDHHLGYAAEHHEDVEPVCSPCHHARERARRA